MVSSLLTFALNRVKALVQPHLIFRCITSDNSNSELNLACIASKRRHVILSKIAIKTTCTGGVATVI